MNIYYAKSILYAYASIEKMIEQIDDLVEKKAICSMDDFSPAEEQCKRIIEFTEQKIALINLKIYVDKILKKFNGEEIDCMDYKYFHIKPKDYFVNFDYTSRRYFRLQIRIAKKFALLIEKAGLDDKKFESEYLSVNFFKELLKRVIEHEEICCKNKKGNKKLKVSENKKCKLKKIA